MAELSGNTEVQARLARVETLLGHVCDSEEFPWFVSDEATLYDVCTLAKPEILARLSHAYGKAPQDIDLQLPIWKLVDRLAPG
ncbi:MAG: hypothetical protein DRJ42_29935 [Deltaproteobacteria bacterium]|nr:MAG: hypothetical protein DRJ42_29935 [Deltaproteobacteria bacterium]